MTATQDEINAALYGNRRRKKGPEASIQDSILEYLNLQRGVQAWRRNVGAVKLENKGKKRYVKFAQPGQSDIWGIGPYAVHIEIEVKQPGEHPTQLQSYWLNMCRAAGAIAFWCDSLDSCIDQLRFEYEKRGWTL